MSKRLEDIISDKNVTSPAAAKNAFMSANNIKDEKQLESNFDTKLGNLWTKMRGGSGPTVTTTGDDKASKVGQAVGGFATQLGKFGDALQTSNFNQLNSDLLKASDITGAILDKNGDLLNVKEAAAKIGTSILAGEEMYLSQQSALLNEINTKTGLTGELSKAYRETLTETNKELLKYGISFDELGAAATKILTDSGRFLLYNEQSFDKFAKVGKAYVGSLDSLVTMFPAFEKVGMGAVMATEEIGKAGQRSLELGLSSQKITKDISENISELSHYGFKNGIQGLAEMTRKATEFRTSLKTAFDIAEKVMDPQGALEFSAKLQVIGGAIGDFNDPLKLMYMSTNNVEGLQNAFIKAAGGLATYNAEQGKFEINSLNMRRARDMAAAMGVDYKELTNTAIAFQERMQAKTSLTGLDMSDEQKEFISNLAHMENGKMTVDIQGTSLEKSMAGVLDGRTSVSIDEIAANKTLRDSFLANQADFKKLSPEKIINDQATNVQQITRYVSFIAASMRKTGGKDVEELSNAMFGKEWANNLTKEIKGAVVTSEKTITSANDKLMSNITNKNQEAKTKSPEGLKTAEKLKEEEATKAASKNAPTTPQQIDINHNIKAESLMDGWTREMVKDSSIADSMVTNNLRSYTTNSIKTK
jgi:hypothetical protein